ncbi:hypothetical protein J2D78_09795 [Microbacterium maritypicum]|uniref:hypothetical protein n=1 Tax=Microbacterium maritypicum TaxID=33918 RepID=UPI001B341F65|nr:hypothetical protein [Microbacterium liquefaciens]MBP5802374.1 hypothetical protein [Microbacterium liquefaciens]
MTGALDPRTPVSDLERVSAELRRINDRLDLLEAPSGTSAFRSVEKLTALVNDIQTALNEYNATRWTNAQIEQRIYAIIGSILAGNVTIGGQLNVLGTVTMLGARGLDLSSASNRVTAWLAGDGRLGHT